MTIDTKSLKELFPVKNKYRYFNFAADGPLPVSSRDAMFEALNECSEEGLMAVHKQVGVFEEIRDELSLFFRSKREHFAFTRNTSEGVLLALLNLNISEDDNYIVAEDAFPTTVKIMDNHCKGQKRTVLINDRKPLLEQLQEVCDNKTQVIVLDWVHYYTGKVIDIESITKWARQKGILTIIDGIQGAGGLSLSLDDSGIDFFVTGAHKWLLSPQGSGFIYASPEVWKKVKRKSFGWLGYDWKDFASFSIDADLREGATVMEYGTRPYITALGFRETLRLFNKLGAQAIETHNRQLKDYFYTVIQNKGYETFSNDRASSIVSFKSPRKNSHEIRDALEKEKIIVSVRNGYVRAAFHFINDMEEVETFVNFL